MISVPLPVERIRRTAGDPRFAAAMRAFYDELDADVASRQPVCVNRGACCRFESFGHNLFVTSAELAYFLSGAGDPLLAPPDRSSCPYQQGGKCTVRHLRPAGCRIFFCDPAQQEWQPAVTEAALHRLTAIGEQFGLPCAYVEWTDGLRAMKQ